MSELVIVRINLNTSVDEYIRRQLTESSAETKAKIQEVIQERKLIEASRIVVNEREEKFKAIVERLMQSEDGINKTELSKEIIELGICSSSSGVTLKLKSFIAGEYVGYELKTTKDKYHIQKAN